MMVKIVKKIGFLVKFQKVVMLRFSEEKKVQVILGKD